MKKERDAEEEGERYDKLNKNHDKESDEGCGEDEGGAEREREVFNMEFSSVRGCLGQGVVLNVLIVILVLGLTIKIMKGTLVLQKIFHLEQISLIYSLFLLSPRCNNSGGLDGATGTH
ncbi:uncharacterized protein [Coffea arabica]|uniref:Uncharacterized protein isoform X3 n=1 Tax=Coffea arabica TaxID=13443 RepID=A0ABM4V6P2_COFAR